MYHRYVEFKPFVAGMFTSHSLRGRILHRALHHQHNRIYNYDSTTVYGSFPHPSPDFTRNFLELVHHDAGGRIFTYVLLLDGQWRFTETGKQFGIDLLSKHTMHSDVSIYVAFAGEFFVRRFREKGESGESEVEAASREKNNGTLQEVPNQDQQHQNAHKQPSHNALHIKKRSIGNSSGSTGHANHNHTAPRPSDTSAYELVIDNDSGTYRPKDSLLPALRQFMEKNLPGLHVTTLDCQADADEMERLKSRQRERRKEESGSDEGTWAQADNVSLAGGVTGMAGKLNGTAGQINNEAEHPEEKSTAK